MEIDIDKVDTSVDDLDLAQLMDQIRQDAEKRKRNALSNGSSLFYRQLITQAFDVLLPQQQLPRNPPTFPQLRLQPALEKREQYQLNDLLGFHDEEFVRTAYRVVLGREPDDAGLAEYLGKLRSGRYNKIDILTSLRFSPEGEKANVRIAGLNRFSAFRKLYRVPIVGYALQVAVAVLRLPVLITNHRRLESHTAAQLERVATHINEAVAYFSDAEEHRLNEISRTQFEVLQQQLEELKDAARSEIDSLSSAHAALKSDVLLRLDQLNKPAEPQVDVAELQELRVQFEKQFDRMLERLNGSKMDLAQRENRLSMLLDGTHRPFAAQLHPDQIQTIENEDDHLLDSLYWSLEEDLRGTPEEIKEEVKVYLPVLENAGIRDAILDVGCGRGEWLEVLREADFQARGIDHNRIQIEHCKSLSLEVIEAEALTYLRGLEEASLNAVTAFHFAEHLPLKSFIRFLDESGRTLKPGGLLILETPNPENLLVGSCNFYLDPSHKNPIPIPTMKLLVEARGFHCQDIMKLHTVSSEIEVKDRLTSDVNHFIYGPMNYAVVARRPGSDTP
ncbi:MAG TPA: methyltransferase domain-containing protein [Pyrinomonadaceae bacterium]|nr:methyltransferase domain-containing protein [Pyrinomonadaceae bacterium]